MTPVRLRLTAKRNTTILAAQTMTIATIDRDATITAIHYSDPCRNPRIPALQTTSDNVYYVRFRVGFSLGKAAFLNFSTLLRRSSNNTRSGVASHPKQDCQRSANPTSRFTTAASQRPFQYGRFWSTPKSTDAVFVQTVTTVTTVQVKKILNQNFMSKPPGVARDWLCTNRDGKDDPARMIQRGARLSERWIGVMASRRLIAKRPSPPTLKPTKPPCSGYQT